MHKVLTILCKLNIFETLGLQVSKDIKYSMYLDREYALLSGKGVHGFGL